MEVHIKLSAKDLFDFSMYTSFKGFTGVINAVISVGAVLLLIVNWNAFNALQRIMLIICAMMFTVIQPAILYHKSKKQAESPAMSEPVNMMFSDEKITVTQADAVSEIDWGQIWDVAVLRSLYVLLMGPRRAFLIPRRDLDGREDEFIGLLKRNLPGSKTKKLKNLPR